MKTIPFIKRGIDFLNRKKGLLLFLALVCAAACMAGMWIAEEYTYFVSGMWEWEVRDFGDHKADFELLAKNLYRYFEQEQENNSQLESILISAGAGEWELYYSYSGTTEEKTEIVSMTEDEQESIQQVMQALHHKYEGFSCITIHSERVAFESVYNYAVIWSRNGKKPLFLFSPEEEGKFYVNRLSFFSNKWYQCILK